MKQNAGPIVMGLAIVAVIALIVVLWRVFLPPTPDYSATPTKLPSQVQKNREMIERFKSGDRSGRPAGMPGSR